MYTAGTPVLCHMANNNFSINSLSANPNFNFLNTLSSQDENDGDFEFNDSPYQTSDIVCEYIDPVSYASSFKNLTDVSILSLNVQSLAAKFCELKELISSLLTFNCAPDQCCGSGSGSGSGSGRTRNFLQDPDPDPDPE